MKRYIFKRTINTIKQLLSTENRVPLYYCDDSQNYLNFGDALNRLIIKKITGREVASYRNLLPVPFIKYYTMIGSILDSINLPNYEIWGSGFMFENALLRHLPRKIHATRGPLTEQKLIKFGAQSCGIYGDPAIVMRKFFTPVYTRSYQLGIIPHYVDQKNIGILNFIRKNDSVLLIDVLNDPEKVISDIVLCDRVISSSLHGLIIADLYGVPNKWVVFSNNVAGKGFKFHDYYHSLGKKDEKCIIVDQNSLLKNIFDNCKVNTITERQIERLYEVMPLKDSRKNSSKYLFKT